jgi:anthranilate phosphoribosyltransferase
MSAVLDLLRKKSGLSAEQAGTLLGDIMEGKLTHDEVKEVLLSLRDKGETVDEIVGFVSTMRAHMREVVAPGAIDIVGTGGDGSGTFNISTASAFVVAGAGVPVAKHGNRAASSKCGSADVLEALGVNIDLTPERASEVFKEVGFVFMLAPLFHPAMKAVGAARKELKVRTVFNLLGPFANPARTRRQLTGVPDKAAADMMSEAAQRLGFERLFIVTSDDGMDEISLSAPTQLYDVTPDGVTKSVIDPSRWGFVAPGKDALLGGDAGHNAGILRALLAGEEGPKRDAVVLNSAFALLVSGAVATVEDGVLRASESIESGAGQAVLDKLIQVTSISG